MFKTIKHFATVLILGVILTFTCANVADSRTEPQPAPTTTIVQKPVQKVSPQDSIRALIIERTDKYLKTKFPNTKLTSDAIVAACEKHDFDICFAMAQAEIESGYGTAGKARKTNSPWNVGAHDGRSAQQLNSLGYGYTHPNQSIEPYIELVKTKYLGDRRTIHDLMNNYVTLAGYRYAGDPTYERTLKATYKRICKETQIRTLQNQLGS